MKLYFSLSEAIEQILLYCCPMFFSDCNVAVELVKYVTIVYNLIYYVWYSFAAAIQAHIRFVQSTYRHLAAILSQAVSCASSCS